MVVKTGVYDDEHEESRRMLAKYPAKFVVDDVMEAVVVAVKAEMTRVQE